MTRQYTRLWLVGAVAGAAALALLQGTSWVILLLAAAVFAMPAALFFGMLRMSERKERCRAERYLPDSGTVRGDRPARRYSNSTTATE